MTAKPPAYPTIRVPTDAQAMLARWMAEDVLQEHIEGLAALYGGVTYHTRRSDRSVKGFPDVALWTPKRPDTLILSELKVDEHNVHGPRWGDEQLMWREILEGVRYLEYYAWAPIHHLTGTIQAVLDSDDLALMMHRRREG